MSAPDKINLEVEFSSRLTGISCIKDVLEDYYRNKDCHIKLLWLEEFKLVCKMGEDFDFTSDEENRNLEMFWYILKKLGQKSAWKCGGKRNRSRSRSRSRMDRISGTRNANGSKTRHRSSSGRQSRARSPRSNSRSRSRQDSRSSKEIGTDMQRKRCRSRDKWHQNIRKTRPRMSETRCRNDWNIDIIPLVRAMAEEVAYDGAMMMLMLNFYVAKNLYCKCCRSTWMCLSNASSFATMKQGPLQKPNKDKWNAEEVPYADQTSIIGEMLLAEDESNVAVSERIYEVPTVQELKEIMANTEVSGLKRTTGIPRSFLTSADSSTPGAKINQYGQVVVTKLELLAFTDNQQQSEKVERGNDLKDEKIETHCGEDDSKVQAIKIIQESSVPDVDVENISDLTDDDNQQSSASDSSEVAPPRKKKLNKEKQEKKSKSRTIHPTRKSLIILSDNPDQEVALQPLAKSTVPPPIVTAPPTPEPHSIPVSAPIFGAPLPAAALRKSSNVFSSYQAPPAHLVNSAMQYVPIVPAPHHVSSTSLDPLTAFEDAMRELDAKKARREANQNRKRWTKGYDHRFRRTSCSPRRRSPHRSRSRSPSASVVLTPVRRRRLVKDIAPVSVQKSSDTELEDGEIVEEDDSDDKIKPNLLAFKKECFKGNMKSAENNEKFKVSIKNEYFEETIKTENEQK